MRDLAQPGPVGVVDATLRDLGAPPWGGAVGTDELARAAIALAAAGPRALEALDVGSAWMALEARSESPWDRLRAVVRAAGRTPVGIVLAARTLWGPRPLGPDLVRRFVLCACESGAARIRAFDPLNRPEALAHVAAAAEEGGAVLVPTLVLGPAPDSADAIWLSEARTLADLRGAVAICLADGGGHLRPARLAELVAQVARATGLPVEVTVQAPAGTAALAALAAVDAGASAVHASAGLMALAAARPSHGTLFHALAGGPRELSADRDRLEEAQRLIGPMVPSDRLRHASAAYGGPALRLPPELAAGLVARLSRLGMVDRLREAAEETAVVARDLGCVTLAAPLGEAVVAQACRHAVEGERWSGIEPVLAAAALGGAGPLRGPVAPAVLTVLEGMSPPPGPLLDLAAAAEGAPGGQSEEDLLLFAQFPEAAARLAARRRSLSMDALDGPGTQVIDRGLVQTLVEVVETAGEAEVSVEVGGARLTVRRAGAPVARDPAAAGAADPHAGLARVESPMVGTFYRKPAPDADPFVEEGQRVEAGQTLCLIEAMKLFNEILADRAGVVRQFLPEDGEPVEYGQLLVLVEP